MGMWRSRWPRCDLGSVSLRFSKKLCRTFPRTVSVTSKLGYVATSSLPLLADGHSCSINSFHLWPAPPELVVVSRQGMPSGRTPDTSLILNQSWVTQRLVSVNYPIVFWGWLALVQYPGSLAKQTRSCSGALHKEHCFLPGLWRQPKFAQNNKETLLTQTSKCVWREFFDAESHIMATKWQETQCRMRLIIFPVLFCSQKLTYVKRG